MFQIEQFIESVFPSQHPTTLTTGQVNQDPAAAEEAKKDTSNNTSFSVHWNRLADLSCSFYVGGRDGNAVHVIMYHGRP